MQKNIKSLKIFLFVIVGIVINLVVFSYVYKCISVRNMLLMLILIVEDIYYAIIIVLMPGAVKRFGNQKWLYIYAICLPLFEYGIIETIAGNIISIRPIYHLVNIVVMYILCFSISAFFKNIKVGLAIINVFFPVLALIEHYVYKLRGRSFMIMDIFSIKTAGQVMGQYTYEVQPRVGIAVLLACALVYLLIWLPKVKVDYLAKTRKMIVVLAAAGGFLFLSNSDVMGKTSATKMNLWNLKSEYHKKGYIFGLLSEMQFLKQKIPEGYSEEEVERIRDIYVDRYKKENETVQAKNVIVIMNESWADFRNIDSEFLSVTPFIDSLNENAIKGWLQVPIFGAGTSNSEYEVLTGNSMQFFKGVDSVYELYTTENEWGMASSAKSLGYHTVAMHPAFLRNWNRSVVYPRMKFDEFYSEDKWMNGVEIEYIRELASDDTCYDALIKLYEEKEKDEKLFSFVVTMQNHGGYKVAEYESTVELAFDADYPRAEQYLSLVKESDNAFSKLINYFKQVEEETMIVMFGDHLPKIEDEFYKELLGESISSVDLLLKQKFYQTPFVIWTNYELDEEKNVQMSANYFGSYIFEKAGLQLTDYDKCRMSFYEEIPVIGTGMVMDKNGNWYQNDEVPEDIGNIVSDYKIIQYNRVFGNEKRVDSIFVIED